MGPTVKFLYFKFILKEPFLQISYAISCLYLLIRCHIYFATFVIGLNQKMLILKRFVTKHDFYVMMTTELFIEYFCNIKLCCLWRFDDKMSVIYWEIICVKILFYIYCFRRGHLYTWQHGRATKMWQRCCWRQGPHCPQWSNR